MRPFLLAHLLLLRRSADARERADGVLGFSVYALAYLIPKLTDPTRQRLGIYVWTGVFVIMAGVLMNVFQMKQPGCASSRLLSACRARPQSCLPGAAASCASAQLPHVARIFTHAVTLGALADPFRIF